MSPRRGYPSDLSDAQWELIEPLLPEPSTGGRPEKHPRREIVIAILYVVRSGCPWRYLPADLPPWQTVYWYFTQWKEAGVTEKLLAALRVKARQQAGRAAQPSAGIIDSQSVKGADTVGRDSRGYDGLSAVPSSSVLVESGPHLGPTITTPRIRRRASRFVI